MSATSHFRVIIEEIPDNAVLKPVVVFTGMVDIKEDSAVVAVANAEVKGEILEKVLCAVAGLEYTANA